MPIVSQVTWVASYTLSEERWFHEPARITDLLDALSSTAFWPWLEVMGTGQRGEPMGDRDAVHARLVGSHACWILAKGDASTALVGSQRDAWVKIDMAPGYLGLGAGARRDVLDHMKAHAIDDFVEVLHTLRRRWGDRAVLDAATCSPDRDFSVAPLTRPRVSNRPLHAIVDVFDPVLSKHGPALAHATPPPGAMRTERDGLVTLRMLADPSDLTAAQRASDAHEAWIGPVIDAPFDDEWEPPEEG
jgi:hypothetical protein